MSMLSIFGAAQGAVAQGLLWGIMTLGVYLTFRILNIADMTCDGSFALGGSTCAILVANGKNPLLAVFVAFFAGLVAGLATGLMHTKLKIHEILAGILSMIALYSINIRIMGKSNIPLLGVQTMMTNMQDTFGITPNVSSFIIGAVFGIALIVLLYWFCGTEIGSCIRATGNNEKMVRAMGVDTDKMKILGLMISNGLIALSGALVAQGLRRRRHGHGRNRHRSCVNHLGREYFRVVQQTVRVLRHLAFHLARFGRLPLDYRNRSPAGS